MRGEYPPPITGAMPVLAGTLATHHSSHILCQTTQCEIYLKHRRKSPTQSKQINQRDSVMAPQITLIVCDIDAVLCACTTCPLKAQLEEILTINIPYFITLKPCAQNRTIDIDLITVIDNDSVRCRTVVEYTMLIGRRETRANAEPRMVTAS